MNNMQTNNLPPMPTLRDATMRYLSGEIDSEMYKELKRRLAEYSKQSRPPGMSTGVVSPKYSPMGSVAVGGAVSSKPPAR
jgi:hypothetical protein